MSILEMIAISLLWLGIALTYIGVFVGGFTFGVQWTRKTPLTHEQRKRRALAYNFLDGQD